MMKKKPHLGVEFLIFQEPEMDVNGSSSSWILMWGSHMRVYQSPERSPSTNKIVAS